MEKQERIKIKDRRGEDLLRAGITDIRWERVILHLEMRLSGPLASTDPVGLALVLVSERGYANGKFRLEESRCGQEGVLLKLSMNITNPGFGMCLANGQYRLAILHGEDLVCESFADYLHEGYGYRTAAPFSGAQYDLISGECLVEAEGVPIEKKAALSGETAKVYEALKTALAALTRLVAQMKGRTNKEIKKLTGEIERLVKKHTAEAKEE